MILTRSWSRPAVFVRGETASVRHCRWVLERLGMPTTQAGGKHEFAVVDGDAREPELDACRVLIRLWDFQVGQPGSGGLASAASGASWVIGVPGSAPGLLPLGMPEKWVGVLASSLLLSAVASGGREHFSLSAADMLHAFARQNFGNHAETPDGWRRNGRTTYQHGGIYPQGFFECQDGLVGAVARSREDWANILRVLGDPEWAIEALRDPVALAHDPSAVDPLFLGELKKYTRDELLQGAIAHGATLAPIFSVTEAEQRGLRLTREGGDPAGLPFTVTPSGLPRSEEPESRGRERAGTGVGGVSGLPLAGVRVVEFCWIWAGPLIGQLLADLGAEVIKVEATNRFDPYRTRGIERRRSFLPREAWIESSPSFHSLNRNKVSLCVDLKQQVGVDLVKALVAKSDAVINNFTAGTLERLGLGFEDLTVVNPEIVSVSMSGFSRGTPLGQMRAYGLVISALAGIEEQILDDDGQVVGSPTFVLSDPNAAMFGLLGVVAGLARRDGGGGGIELEISQLEAAFTVAGAMGGAGSRATTILETAVSGEYLAIDAGASMPIELQAAISAAPTGAAMELCAGRNIPVTKVNSLSEVDRSPTFAASPPVLTSHHPVTGAEALVAAPWRTAQGRAPLRKPAPLLGEGTVYVLRRVLGLGEDDIKDLTERGVVDRSRT